ncbi:hypothetical protein B0J11DRAFT_277517 [Dendryphion nanum]|uniref:Secreted protein n=1 Tax=Dendryphion nanum TaxID=256645 RepID=A0A9P9E0C3_9PLEO|nr:hypothetical protein B0J11DRAFT_277517 [Dendryphion nanum]
MPIPAFLFLHWPATCFLIIILRSLWSSASCSSFKKSYVYGWLVGRSLGTMGTTTSMYLDSLFSFLFFCLTSNKAGQGVVKLMIGGSLYVYSLSLTGSSHFCCLFRPRLPPPPDPTRPGCSGAWWKRTNRALTNHRIIYRSICHFFDLNRDLDMDTTRNRLSPKKSLHYPPAIPSPSPLSLPGLDVHFGCHSHT